MTPSPLAANARVADLYAQSCVELLSAYGLTERVHREEDAIRRREGASYVSVLALTGAGIRLVSTMDLDVPLLASTYPASETAPSQRDLEDWCREMNNQLAGRLKNKLLPLGCELMLGLPSLLTGTEISPVAHDAFDTRQSCFSSPHGDMVLTLSSHFDPGFALADAPAEPAGDDEGLLLEGGFQLF